MHADSSTAASLTIPTDPARLDALIQTVLPFASLADAFARRSAGKVRTLAFLGLISAGWIAYACADTFAWRLTTLLVVFSLIALPAAVLWKMQRALHETIGLPHRIRDVAVEMAGKAEEYRQHFAKRHPLDPVSQRPRLSQLWRTGKALLEVKALGDEAQALVSASAGAMVLASPMFLIAFAAATATVLMLVGAAAIVALAYFV